MVGGIPTPPEAELILYRPTLRAAFATEVAGVTLNFVVLPKVGAAAHLPDDHPNVEAVRARAHQFNGWEVYTDVEVPHIVDHLMGRVPASTPGAVPPSDIGSRPASAPQADAGVDPRVLELCRAAGCAASDLPLWVTMAVKNGWAYDDITGAGGDYDGQGVDITAKGGHGARSKLTGEQLIACSPPPGWPIDGKVPWEIPGWIAPPGFVAPTRPHVVVPDVPVDEPVDERFTPDGGAPTEPAPTTDGASDLDDADADADADQGDGAKLVGPDESHILSQLVVAGAVTDLEQAALILKIAREVPPAGGGNPAPRGKVNTKLRARDLANLSPEAFEILLPLLPRT